MKVNIFIKDWFLSTVLSFVVYETLWNVFLLHTWNISDWKISCFDIIYCGLFVAIGLSVGKLFCKFRYFKCFTLGRQIILVSIIFTLNMIIACLFEFCYDRFVPAENDELFHNGIYLFCIISSMLTSTHTIGYYFYIIAEQKEQLFLQKRQNLKNKLDPHFVFNSLSVLTELIHQEPKLAEEYCVRFSRLYRHLLVSFDKDYISINESLVFVQEYVKLQQYRMEGKIELDIRCFANTLEEYLFPLSLQTLVENSIKHNIPSVGEVLRITITRDENYMIVTNNIIGEPSTPLSFGIGLQTLYLQYKMNNLPEPSIEHNMEMFEVRIMILKKINNE